MVDSFTELLLETYFLSKTFRCRVLIFGAPYDGICVEMMQMNNDKAPNGRSVDWKWTNYDKDSF